MNSLVLNINCMEYMRSCKYKEFDLAVVDPPYYGNPKNIIIPGGHLSTTGVRRTKYHMPRWSIPDAEYFHELQRISKAQIIWGVNYFPIASAMGTGRIVWDKRSDNGTKFSDCEIAYCSLEKTVRIVRYMWNGMIVQEPLNKEARIHPTQKPIALYRWIFKKYTKIGNRVFDSHLGSGSSRIAAQLLGLDFVGCEIDKNYFEAQESRYAGFLHDELAQQNIDLGDADYGTI